MSAEAIARVADYLDRCTTMTMATSGQDGPWAASLFFARDDDLNLYFISSEDTRHARELTADPQVAVTINLDYGDWREIKGVQMAARASAVEDKDLARVKALYLERFPAVRELLSAPAGGPNDEPDGVPHDEDENTVSAKFGGSRFYVVRPTTVRYIDNAERFGHREEFSLNDER